jgi:hypothetical protein
MEDKKEKAEMKIHVSVVLGTNAAGGTGIKVEAGFKTKDEVDDFAKQHAPQV